MVSYEKTIGKASRFRQVHCFNPDKKADVAACSLLYDDSSLYHQDKLDNRDLEHAHLRRIDSAVTAGPRLVPYYEVLENFDSVDKMMADARAADAAARLPHPPIEQPPPPTDYKISEYFAKIGRKMAKIADGIIEDA